MEDPPSRSIAGPTQVCAAVGRSVENDPPAGQPCAVRNDSILNAPEDSGDDARNESSFTRKESHRDEYARSNPNRCRFARSTASPDSGGVRLGARRLFRGPLRYGRGGGARFPNWRRFLVPGHGDLPNRVHPQSTVALYARSPGRCRGNRPFGTGYPLLCESRAGVGCPATYGRGVAADAARSGRIDDHRFRQLGHRSALDPNDQSNGRCHAGRSRNDSNLVAADHLRTLRDIGGSGSSISRNDLRGVERLPRKWRIRTGQSSPGLRCPQRHQFARRYGASARGDRLRNWPVGCGPGRDPDDHEAPEFHGDHPEPAPGRGKDRNRQQDRFAERRQERCRTRLFAQGAVRHRISQPGAGRHS